MKQILALLAACLLTLQVAPAQLMGNINLPPLTGTHVDISKYTGDGFKAEYYNGSNFEEKVLTRVDKEINFFLIYKSPAEGINAEHFSIRWTGKLYAPKTGMYNFLFMADDAVRLWVNNKLIIDKWHLNRPTKFSGKIALTGKQVYDLKIEYSQMKPSAAVAKAYWTFEQGPEEPINPDYLFSSAGKLPPVVSIHKKAAPVVKKTPPNKPISKSVIKEEDPGESENDASDEPSPEKEPLKPAIKDKSLEVTKETPAKTFENLAIGKSIILNHIFFDQSKHELRPESYEELDKLANTLKKYQQMKITITGHTDNVGDFNLNVQLSNRKGY
jgi:outer membrane protein OmpA-like peptidoglycan-associated protein